MNARVLADRYELGRMLGAGGMAEVYEGWDRVLARRVAVKVLSGRYADDPSFLERFRREARAAASLNHPNIVGVFDTGSDNGVSFIVMELVEGRSLRDRLTDGPLTPAQVSAVGVGVCSALAAAHANRLVHRDIKPGNIMLLPTGQVKVMDFGIARAIASEPLTNNTANVLGTAQYLAPEQAQGGEIDARADIYAFGCCVYEMLTGRVPFNGESPVAIAYQQVREAPLPLRQIDPEIPPALEAVTLRAMAKRPEDRFQSAEEMRAAFEHARAGQPVGPPTPGALQPAPGAAPGSVPRAGAGGPGAAVMAGAAGLGAGTGAGLANPAMASASMAAPGAMAPAGPGGYGAAGYGGPGAPTSIFGTGTGPIGSRAARTAAAAEEGGAVRNRLPVIMAVITVVLLLGTAGAAIKVLNPGSPPNTTRPPLLAAFPSPDPTDTSFLDDETSSSLEETTTTSTTRRTTTTAPPTTARQTTTTRRQTTTTSRRTTTTTGQERVPDVVDRTQAIAEATLDQAGFDVNTTFVEVTDPNQNNRVQSQNPAGGTFAPRGSTVTIVVGQLPEP